MARADLSANGHDDFLEPHCFLKLSEIGWRCLGGRNGRFPADIGDSHSADYAAPRSCRQRRFPRYLGALRTLPAELRASNPSRDVFRMGSAV
jgi:hypothetical protein